MHGKKILVFGGTGALGRQILEQGLVAGANMTAFVRDPRRLTLTHENLSVVAGDATYDREDQLRGTELDWTIVYPVKLNNGPKTESYRVGEKMAMTGLATISRADVADFILKQLADTQFVRKAAVVTS